MDLDFWDDRRLIQMERTVNGPIQQQYQANTTVFGKQESAFTSR